MLHAGRAERLICSFGHSAGTVGAANVPASDGTVTVPFTNLVRLRKGLDMLSPRQSHV